MLFAVCEYVTLVHLRYVQNDGKNLENAQCVHCSVRDSQLLHLLFDLSPYNVAFQDLVLVIPVVA